MAGGGVSDKYSIGQFPQFIIFSNYVWNVCQLWVEGDAGGDLK